MKNYQGDRTMNTTKIKNTLGTLVIIFLLFSPILQQTGYAQGTSADTKRTLVFLNDVIGLDVSKYNVHLVSSGIQDYTNDKNPIGNLGYIQTTGEYTLSYWDPKIENETDLSVTFSFINATLRTVNIYVLAGTPSGPNMLPSNIITAADTFLERYKSFTGDVKIDSMREILSTVKAPGNIVKDSDGLILQISMVAGRTAFQWIESQNGVDYGRLTIEFKDGAFDSFYDDRTYTTIGSSDVNISKEEAVDLALKQANGFSYNYNGQLIGNLTIVQSQIRANLTADVRDKPSAYYPCWTVDLPLKNIAPGSIYYLEAKIWADTGQLISFKEMGYGGPDQEESSEPTPTASSSITENDSISNNSLISSAAIIAAIVTAILLSIFVAVKINKKRKSD
jgi:hypothetical protein